MTSRSGRVTIPTGGEKTVIADGLTGNTHAMYRFFNSGKYGQKIQIWEKGATQFLAEVEWKDSVDVPVAKNAIIVKAVGTGTDLPPAEVVYDFLALT